MEQNSRALGLAKNWHAVTMLGKGNLKIAHLFTIERDEEHIAYMSTRKSTRREEGCAILPLSIRGCSGPF